MSYTQRETRSQNKTAHPGLPDVDETVLARPIPKARRTRQEVLDDQAAAQVIKDRKAESEQEEAHQKVAGIKKIAALENKMREDTAKAAVSAAHPAKRGMLTQKVDRPKAKRAGRRQGVEVKDSDSESGDPAIQAITETAGARYRGAISRSPELETTSDVDVEMEDSSEPSSIGWQGQILSAGGRDAGKGKAAVTKTETPKVRTFINDHAHAISGGRNSEFSDDSGVQVDVGEKRKAISPISKFPKKAKGGPLGSHRLTESKHLGFSTSSNPPSESAPSEPDTNFDYGGYEDEADSIQEVENMPTGAPAIIKHATNLKPIVRIQQPSKDQVSALNTARASEGTRKARRVIFNNHNLPSGVYLTWVRTMLPRWMQHVGLLKTPWNLGGDALGDAQELWDVVFPMRGGSDILKASGEPIYALLKQRTYEWRNGFLTAATVAVKAFWDADLDFKNAVNRAAYVEWGIPNDPDEPTPITWATVDESDPDNIIFRGAFQSPAIIATFAHHLAILDTIPADDIIDDHAAGALALSATAVEQAFKRWSSGECALKAEPFSAALSDKTSSYLTDIEGISEKGWAKIMKETRKVLEQKPGSLKTVTDNEIGTHAASFRRRIVDADDSG